MGHTQQESDVEADNVNGLYVDLVQTVLQEKRNDVFATWYGNTGQPTNQYTFGELWEEAGLISHHLRNEWGLSKGDRVVLCYNFGLHFFASFLGCLRAGVVAVLVYPPNKPFVKSLTKMNKVVEDCDAKLMLIDSDVNLLKWADSMNPLSKSRHLWPQKIDFKITDKLYDKKPTRKSWLMTGRKNHLEFDEQVQPEDLAFLQYTSGSTGDPKGVMVTHRALVANVKVIRNGILKTYNESGGMPNEIVGCSWLPQYHDMGLVLGIVTPFGSGWRQHMMSPITFIQKPLLWIELMSRHKVSWGVSPDFGYRLVAKKFKEAKERNCSVEPIPGLDLSSIRWLSNAAEPIRVDTWGLFQLPLAKYGLGDKTFQSSYGLAENVVGVSYIHEHHLSSPRDVDDGKSLVASGSRSTMDSSITVKIVDPRNLQEVNDGETGEIWVGGSSKAAGYFKRPELTKEVFCAKLDNDATGMEYLRTGDLGFFQDEYLFICGRIKDLIIINGVNYYPQDIEYAVQAASPAVRPGCVAAFSSSDIGDDGGLEVVFEIRGGSSIDVAAVTEEVRRSVSDTIGVVPFRVAAIPERSIPKTTSGKIQRRSSRSSLHEGRLKTLFESTEFSALDDSTTLTEDRPKKHLALEIPSGEFSDEIFDELSEDTKCNDALLIEAERTTRDVDAVYTRFFGDNLDYRRTWDDIGLSSLVSVQLRDAIQSRCRITVPLDCFERYPTPDELKSFVTTYECGSPLRRDLPTLTFESSLRSSLPYSWLCFLQALGVTLLLALFSLSMVLPYYFVRYALQWFWIPLVFPVWMLSYTAIVLLSKWMVIGRYSQFQTTVSSYAYLRWWWMDRAIHLWEFFVGNYIKNTVLLWLVYRLMGAKIDPSAKLKAMIREPDLVEIGAGATLEHRIGCRMFDAPDQLEEPIIRFRPVRVEKKAVVRGMLSPGCFVGEAAYVETRSVVLEGAQVPPGSIVKGNPAYELGVAPDVDVMSFANRFLFETLKILWLLVEVYLGFSCLAVGSLFLDNHLPKSWRYSNLCYGFLLVLIMVLLMFAVSIVLKWVLIGKRHPGSYKESLWRLVGDWIVDYHYSIGAFLLLSLTSNSKIWNVILILHGMDIDLFSKVTADSFPPSKVDLISIRRSFMPMTTFETSKDEAFHRTIITNSSIGFNALIKPGVTIKGSVVAPLTIVDANTILESEGGEAPNGTENGRLARHWLTIDALYTSWILILFGSFIPAYELWTSIFQPVSVEQTILVLALLIAVQTAVWIAVLYFVQLVTFGGTNQRKTPWSKEVYMLYITVAWSVQSWSFLPALWGTPFFNAVARFLGAKFQGKGRVLYLGDQFYDLSYLTIDLKTEKHWCILDNSHLMSHYAVYDDITLGATKVSGILREMTFVMANAVVSAEQNDPWRAISSDPVKDVEASSMTLHNSRDLSIVTSDSNIEAPPKGDKSIYGWITRFIALRNNNNTGVCMDDTSVTERNLDLLERGSSK